jgi:excisionase family DNA binding protein
MRALARIRLEKAMTVNPAAAKDWLTVKEAAGHLGVSEATIFRMMRSGDLSFFKVGTSTRFRKEILDLAVQKVTSKAEAASSARRCAACGHGFLVPGTVRSTGLIYFQPEKTKFWVFSDSMAEVKAHACPVCGHVQMFTDTAKLQKLMKDEDAAASKKSGTDTAKPQRTQRDAEDDDGADTGDAGTADERR